MSEFNNISTLELIQKLQSLLSTELLEKFYPYTLDRLNGGFLCNMSYDWKFVAPQDKMIVTQARHTWTPSKAAHFYPDDPRYPEAAKHGYQFLKDVMWDSEFGGFYTIRNPQGGLSDYRGYFDEKRTYGNAFAIYALAAYYELTKEKEILDFAIKGFEWIEKFAYDSVNGGYFQFLTRQGPHFSEENIKNTKASDANEAPFKDQNSSIHLLEAYTELYNVWKNDKLKSRLNELLTLIRDKITTEKGYMNLFFDNKWNPISFRDSTETERIRNFGLDHVSFGHDYETAFLMLEASYTLGLKNDTETLITAKKMLDHALQWGLDEMVGGFYDAGYYLKGSDKCTIIHDTKNWWAQAEGLNALLLMAKIFPEEEKYFNYFLRQLDYVDKYFIDHEYGGWYEGGIDKEPHLKEGPKGHIWKACYHEGRSLMNCIKMLSNNVTGPLEQNPEFIKVKNETSEFLKHWNKIGKSLK